MRLFVAIDLSSAARQHLRECMMALRGYRADGISFTRDANLHLTIKFLGEVADAEVPRVCEALESVPVPPPLHLRASGLECFPPRGAIRIIAAALGGDLDPLVALAQQIDHHCHEVGFPLEARRFRPHVTLGRVKAFLPPQYRQQINEAAGRFPGPPFTAEQFLLVHSTLKPQGAEYAVAERFELGPAVQDGSDASP